MHITYRPLNLMGKRKDKNKKQTKRKVSENGLVDCLVLVLHYYLFVIGIYSDTSNTISIILLILYNFESIKD